MPQYATFFVALCLSATAHSAAAWSPGLPPPGYGHAPSPWWPPPPVTTRGHHQQLAYQVPRLPHPGANRSGSAGRQRAAAAVPHDPQAGAAATSPGATPARAANGVTGTTAGDGPTRGLGDNRQGFLDRLRPLIERENRRLLDTRAELTGLFAALDNGGTLDAAQRKRVQTLSRKYRVDADPETVAAARAALLRKIDAVPLSMALAQAANESAWGRSRFAREGNNLFGIWTYDESKGIVPRQRAPGKKHLVRRFDSLSESVRYYLFTLNSHPAYAEMREIRARLRTAGKPLDGLALAEGLTRYSAKGAEYVRIIQDMIRRFDLAAYDAGSKDEA